MENWVNYAPFFGVAGVIFAFFLFAYVKSFPSGNEVMIDLEDQINKGAMAFLKREYSILVVFIAVVFALLWWGIKLQCAMYVAANHAAHFALGKFLLDSSKAYQRHV